jgi:hypothetical protein
MGSRRISSSSPRVAERQGARRPGATARHIGRAPSATQSSCESNRPVKLGDEHVLNARRHRDGDYRLGLQRRGLHLLVLNARGHAERSVIRVAPESSRRQRENPAQAAARCSSPHAMCQGDSSARAASLKPRLRDGKRVMLDHHHVAEEDEEAERAPRSYPRRAHVGAPMRRVFGGVGVVRPCHAAPAPPAARICSTRADGSWIGAYPPTFSASNGTMWVAIRARIPLHRASTVRYAHEGTVEVPSRGPGTPSGRYGRAADAYLILWAAGPSGRVAPACRALTVCSSSCWPPSWGGVPPSPPRRDRPSSCW